MADANQGMPEIKGTLPLYKKPEPLNVQAHKGKGLKYGDRPFDFLNETHFVPVTVGEFANAGGVFPLIFLGDTKTVVAVMGLQAGENLFVDPNTGAFSPFSYVPAYVRRYPFVGAVHTNEEDRFTVCVDAGSHLFSDTPDVPFFNEDGKPSEFTERAIDFVRRFEADVAATQAFIDRMKELDLFEEQQTNFQPRDNAGQPVGEPQVVATYWGISLAKVNALPTKTLEELRDNRYLGAIYAHLLSMARWDQLLARAASRNGQKVTAAVAQPSMAPPPPEA
ncbi:MAG TPA: peptidase [Oceanicaulis sp.]|uniref:Peptidase n=1 Tax=Glycocaulis albus TaxID=1382801 RepID=A0ABQ1XU80_9PROT|nr:SapC family protein [Glycocaulis albus]MBV5258852.1 SapC family protein [Synechococcus moorigangaii CMS01]GGH03229.1 peptidase [Glycocaulis albus]HCY54848.1 peptidase [Oceanicaulis sp.]